MKNLRVRQARVEVQSFSSYWLAKLKKMKKEQIKSFPGCNLNMRFAQLQNFLEFGLFFKLEFVLTIPSRSSKNIKG
jgi:hypothetical protein